MPAFNDPSISSTSELMQSIFDSLTIALSNAWSGNGIDTIGNVMGLSTGDLYVQFSWNSNTINISQSTGTNPIAAYNAEAGDSNFISDVDFPTVVTDAEVWIFANESAVATDRYCYVVIEFNRDGRFMHFGFGHIPSSEKFFPWVGGAFKYGAQFNPTNDDEPWSQNHRGPLLDSTQSGTTGSSNLPTLAASGLRGQDPTSKWLAMTEGNPSSVATQSDVDGAPISTGRAFARYGPGPSLALFQRGSANSATVNLVPVQVCFSPSDASYMPLANMPDVRMVNIGNIQPKDVITIGSNTWQFFPWGQKLTLFAPGNIATRNLGIAYRVT